MYRKFKISIDEVIQLLDVYGLVEYDPDYSRLAKCMFWNHESFVRSMLQGEVVDGTRIKNHNFGAGRYDVFISHSYEDINVVKLFATLLEEKYGLKCFVDSLAWESAYALQRKIDEEYSHDDSDWSLFDYQKCQKSASHVFAILSMALMDMINRTECCLFIGSECSLNLQEIKSNPETFSPWIYEEVCYMNYLPAIKPQRINKAIGEIRESFSDSYYERELRMSHQLDLSGFYELKVRDFRSDLSGTDFLESLYNKYSFQRNIYNISNR